MLETITRRLVRQPDVNICKACKRKLDNTGVRVDRTAFGGLLQEVFLDTRAEDIGDLETYPVNRGDEIRTTLRDSVELNK